jgi:hypothetical protein
MFFIENIMNDVGNYNCFPVLRDFNKTLPTASDVAGYFSHCGPSGQ